MNELLLEQAELLALLDAVQARAIVSISPAHLFPVDVDERHAEVQRGNDSLLERGLLR